MGRIICLDIGDKRIGVAVSDPFNSMALPLETIFRKNATEDFKRIEELCIEKDAELIVCGMPVNFDGSESIQTIKTRKFIEELKMKINLPVEEVDERFTTLEARRVLIEGDMRRDDRKKVIDKIAASYILEGYLDKRKLAKK